MLLALINTLEEGHRYLWGLHILGVVFGLGGASVTDVLFIQFMRNFRIERREKELMEVLSKVVWAGIILLLLSGLGMLLPQWETLLTNDRFLMKMTAVAVVIVNGIFLNLWIQPRARHISFVEHDKGKLDDEDRQDQIKIRRSAFALGAVSFVAWYGAFALSVLNMLTLGYLLMLTLFIGALVAAVGASQVHERLFRRQVEEEPGEKLVE